MGRKDEIVVGLDIGTTKVCVVVGEPAPSGGGVDIVGVGTAQSKGMRKGTVVHLEETVRAVRAAVEEAELMAGCKIASVHTGIAGGHIRGLSGHGIVAVAGREVRPSDVQRVLEAARSVAMPMDREVIHVLPREFIVDDQHGVRDPVGMSGCRLEVKVHIVTAAATSAADIINACTQAGLTVDEIALQPLASAEAVLTRDERDMGVALVDIGGGTTDIALFAGGGVLRTVVLPVGGQHLTADIAQALRTPRDAAERLKQKYGCALAALVTLDEDIEVPAVGGRSPGKVPRKVLSEIIEARTVEILALVRRELDSDDTAGHLHSGVVLTGGCTMLRGLVELAQDVLECDVRRGVPEVVGGLSTVVRAPKFATGVGLVLQAASKRLGREAVLAPGGEAHFFDRVRRRVSGWWAEAF